MDLRDSPEEAAFRNEVRAWLADHVVGEFVTLAGRGGMDGLPSEPRAPVPSKAP